LRQADGWFSRLIEHRTGWRSGRVFRLGLTGGDRDTLFLSAPRDDFHAGIIDIRRLLSRRLLDDKGRLNFDLPGFCAWTMGRFEEERPQSGEAMAREFTASTVQGLGKRAYVDTLVERFCDEVLEARKRRGYATPPIERPWPKGKQAAVCLVHQLGETADSRSWLSRLFSKGSGGGRFSLEDLPQWRQLELDAGICSTLVATPKVRTRYLDALLKQDGCATSLGYAPAPRELRSPATLAAAGIRFADQHSADIGALHIGNGSAVFPRTWQRASQAGFKVTISSGWQDGSGGFRSGTCWPFHPMKLPGIGVEGELTEIPYSLILDDSTDPGAAVERSDRFLSQALQVGGVLGIVHRTNSSPSSRQKRSDAAMAAVVEALASRSDIWFAGADEIAEQFGSTGKVAKRS
jgi:hypothetical protein